MQILAIDLGTETIPALGLGVEKPEPGIMKVRPRSQSRRIIDKTVLFRGYVFLGLLNTVFVLLAIFWCFSRVVGNSGYNSNPVKHLL
jgi:magnesium-transporting ATPase (P-type)